MRDKIKFLNFSLMSKYNDKFIKYLGEEKGILIEITSQEDYCK